MDMEAIEDDFWVSAVHPDEEIDEDDDPMCVEDSIPKEESAFVDETPTKGRSARIERDKSNQDVFMGEQESPNVPICDLMNRVALTHIIPDQLYFGVSPGAFYEMLGLNIPETMKERPFKVPSDGCETDMPDSRIDDGEGVYFVD